MRIHLFEFEDLKWFPESIRSGATDYLSFLLKTLRFYDPAAQFITGAAEKSGNEKIVDLCSGGGGPAKQLICHIPDKHQIILTDKFPNHKAWKFIQTASNGRITFSENPVDAIFEKMEVPGLRTMFSAAHHFKPDQLRQLIKNISSQNNPVMLFDGGNKNPLMIAALAFIHPVLTLVSAPFLKPFRTSRIFFTWLLPFIPIVAVWDGMVSILRLYTPEQLLKIAREAAPHYNWEAGYLKSKYGLRIAFLSGYSHKENPN